MPYTIDSESKFAVDVDADFRWETAYKSGSGGPKFALNKAPGSKDVKKSAPTKEQKGHEKKRSWFQRKDKTQPVLPTSDSGEKKEPSDEKNEDQPFALQNMRLQIPKGSFVAVVGRVGSGKVPSSLCLGIKPP